MTGPTRPDETKDAHAARAFDGRRLGGGRRNQLGQFNDAMLRTGQENLGDAGSRLHGTIDRATTMDEIAAFLEASQVRAVGKNLLHGLSIKTRPRCAVQSGAADEPCQA